MSEDGTGIGRERPEPSFADVLNNLTMDSGRGRSRRRRGRQAETVVAPVEEVPVVEPEPIDEWGSWDEPEDSSAVVRPYTWTRGRTRPVYDLAIETLVSTSAHGRDVAALASVEHRTVAELCIGPRSLAEVAAVLTLPLGVAKVLLGDMADLGLVIVHQVASKSGGAPDKALMERVLSGLRRL